MAIVVGVLAVLFWAGWLAPAATDTRAHATAALRAPVFVHPGAVLAEAARRFNGAGADAGADAGHDDIADAGDASVDVTPVAQIQAPKVDISQTFRRELSAVVSENGSRQILLRAPGEGPRRVPEGGIYRDGWRVATISADAIVLRKRRETRRVTVIGEYQQASMTSDIAASGAPAQVQGRRLVLSRQEARTRRP